MDNLTTIQLFVHADDARVEMSVYCYQQTEQDTESSSASVAHDRCFESSSSGLSNVSTPFAEVHDSTDIRYEDERYIGLSSSSVAAQQDCSASFLQSSVPKEILKVPDAPRRRPKLSELSESQELKAMLILDGLLNRNV